jgi:hypothetical protein
MQAEYSPAELSTFRQSTVLPEFTLGIVGGDVETVFLESGGGDGPDCAVLGCTEVG